MQILQLPISLLPTESLVFMKYFQLAKPKWFGNHRSVWDSVGALPFCLWHMAVHMQQQISLTNPKIVKTALDYPWNVDLFMLHFSAAFLSSQCPAMIELEASMESFQAFERFIV